VKTLQSRRSGWVPETRRKRKNIEKNRVRGGKKGETKKTGGGGFVDPGGNDKRPQVKKRRARKRGRGPNGDAAALWIKKGRNVEQGDNG